MKTLSMYVNKENAVRVWTAAKPWLIFTAELAAAVVLWTLYQLCRGVAWLGWHMETAMRSGKIIRAAEDFYRQARPKQPAEKIFVGSVIGIMFVPVVLFASAAALAGAGARRALGWFEGGAV